MWTQSQIKMEMNNPIFETKKYEVNNNKNVGKSKTIIEYQLQ